MTVFEKAREFIYRNAGPIDLARFQYHFEGGEKENVLSALSYYQNDDGGFAYALEPDCCNPNSSPIQTWAAAEILREIDFTDNDHPLIKGILKYLESGVDFDKEHNQWLNVVSSNNDFPHAIWWGYGQEGSEFKYNPTAYLAGFIIKFADEESSLYKMGIEIAKEAVNWFSEKVPFAETHITACFIRLYEYLADAKADVVDMDLFTAKLKEQVDFNICRDTEKWGKEYVPMPSYFIENKNSIFYPDNSELAKAECVFLAESQLPDGSYPVPFTWCTEYKEQEIALNRWKSDFIIKNILFLKRIINEKEIIK